MADVKISGLPASTTPLAGTEVLPIVQGGQTKQVSVNNLTAGKAVTASSLTATNIKTSSTTANLDISGTTVAATGSDANIDVNINAKGSGIAYLNQAWGVNQSGTLVPAANSTYDIGNGVNNPRDVGIARNIAFTGTGNRINGDFSNATYANRVLFQTTTTNSPSSIGVIPNGTGVNASLFLDSDSAATNSSRFAFQMLGGSEARITSDTLGTGTALPLTMYTGGAERLRVFTSGGVSIGNTTDPGATNLSVSGSIQPQATPSSKWGIDFAIGGSASNLITLTSGATYDLATGSGVVYLWENGGNGVGVFYTYYGVVNINFQNGALYTNSSGNPATVNVFFNPGTSKYRIQNNFATTLQFYISTIRLRDSV